MGLAGIVLDPPVDVVTENGHSVCCGRHVGKSGRVLVVILAEFLLELLVLVQHREHGHNHGSAVPTSIVQYVVLAHLRVFVINGG